MRSVPTGSIFPSCPRRSLPIKYKPARAKITSVNAIASGRETMFHPQTRSALEINFMAAASSMNPSVTLTDVIHEPAFGNFDNPRGNIASPTNGRAKAVLKISIPVSGLNHSPPAAAASNPPTNGAVHENETSVSVTPMNNTPAYPLLAFPCAFAAFTNCDGKRISYIPSNDNAKTMSTPAMKRFTQGFAAIV